VGPPVSLCDLSDEGLSSGSLDPDDIGHGAGRERAELQIGGEVRRAIDGGQVTEVRVVINGFEPVGAEYWVAAGQAVFRYWLMSPSHRLDFTTRKWRWITEGGASVPSGGYRSMERWGRCSL
jgi:hypothetical protein